MERAKPPPMGSANDFELARKWMYHLSSTRNPPKSLICLISQIDRSTTTGATRGARRGESEAGGCGAGHLQGGKQLGLRRAERGQPGHGMPTGQTVAVAQHL